MCDETNMGAHIVLIRNTRELGGFLRQTRENAGLTQAQLAAKLNVRRQRVLYLERGDGQILMGFVFAVIHELGIDLSLQMSGKSPAASSSQESAATPAPYSIDDIADGGLN
jgi:HTH-type transcriptional regulator / antitoxin HipB